MVRLTEDSPLSKVIKPAKAAALAKAKGLRTIGLSIMGLMVVLVTIMIAIAALKPEGAIRKNMTAIGVLLFAGLVMGAGTAFVGYMISLGSEVAG